MFCVLFSRQGFSVALEPALELAHRDLSFPVLGLKARATTNWPFIVFQHRVSLIPALRRQRHVELCKFEASLVSEQVPGQAPKTTQRNPVLKN